MTTKEICVSFALLLLAGCPSDGEATTTDAGSSTTAGSETEDPTNPTEPNTTGEPTTGEPTTGEPTTGEPTTGVDTTAGEPTSGDTSGGAEVCLGGGEGAGAVDDACAANSDCASGVCTIYTDVPLNVDAVCATTPANCATRVTGTIFDFSTGEPVSGANLVVTGALQAATNPTGATEIVAATSDSVGRIDVTSEEPISTPLGIVGLASAGGYYLTSTGIAAPVDGASYEVGTGIHDLWMVPEGDLADWSDELSFDPVVDPSLLPLGDMGGVIGFVRGETGLPVESAVITSTVDSSVAIVRYLNEDGTFNDTMTSTTGVFVVLDPGIPEDFEATLNGSVIGGGTAGSASNVVFTMVISTDQ